MIITIQGHGILADWLGCEALEISLPEASTYQNAKSQLHGLLIQRLPEKIQIGTAEQFFSQLIVLVNGQPVSREMENIPLNDGDTINLYTIMAGG